MQTYHFAQISTNLMFHPKLYKLSKILGVPKAQALGHLAAVWAWAVTYSPGGVIDPNDPTLDLHFLCEKNDSCTTKNDLLNAMIEVGFIENRRGILHLHDWKDHTGWHLRNKAQNKERQAKFRCKGKDSVTVTQGSNAGVTEGSNAGVTRDSNGGEKQPVTDILTKLNKAKLNKANLKRDVESPSESLSRSAPSKEKTPGSKVWGAYSVAMEAVYGTAPASTAAGYAMSKKLVEMVGYDKAVRMVEIFPYVKNSFYSQRGHPLECLLKDYMAILPMLDFEAKAPEREEKKLERSKTEDEFFKSLGI